MLENELAQRQYELGLLNRRIAANVSRLDDTYAHITGKTGSLTLLCACGCDDCDRLSVTLPLAEYDRLCQSPHRFLIARGHATEVDDVVYAGDGYEIVEIKPEYRSASPLTAE